MKRKVWLANLIPNYIIYAIKQCLIDKMPPEDLKYLLKHFDIQVLVCRKDRIARTNKTNLTIDV